MRVTLISAGIMFLFISTIPTVYASGSGTTYEVGANNLNVRSAPSRAAQILGKLQDDDRVVAFQERYGWVQTYYDGKKAWVASQFLFQSDSNKNTSSMSESASKHITVTATEVRIRKGPGTQYGIIGYTTSGDTFKLLEQKNNWNKVVLSDGSTGWIAGWLTNYNTSNHSIGSVKNENNQGEPQPSASLPLEGYDIILDPGHGGKDPGAIGVGGTFEKNVIMDTTSNVAQQLRQAGANVILTRNDDTFISLDKRVKISNAHHTDAFISLHYNSNPAVTANGISTHFYTNGNDRTLARNIQTGLTNNTVMSNRGIIQSDYHVLRENSDLAVLIELGFITNPIDMKTINTEFYQTNAANGIVDGLKQYFK